MSNITASRKNPGVKSSINDAWSAIKMPVLAILMGFIIGGVVIWITSGSLQSVGMAYFGLLRGAFFKQRGFTETLVATIPYVLLSLAVSVGFKTGLFNIGVEGQFTIGSICAAWVGASFSGLPAIIHLPLTLLAGAVGGGLWAAIPGYLKAKMGAHEVISTMMMNYIAFRLTEFFILYSLRDNNSTGIQTIRISPQAELWSMAAIPDRLQEPSNALFAGLIIAVITMFLVRLILKTDYFQNKLITRLQLRISYLSAGILTGLFTYLLLPGISKVWWPFTDQYDRLHTGLLIALMAVVFIWWLMSKTTFGFELRTVGANPNGAKYAGINLSRSIIMAMMISGALAGLAGTVEVLGVSICKCLPLFFSSGYGWDSIGISLLAKNNPFGILAASLLFGAMRNGADLMELSSGVSKYIISLIQALVLLFVAAPSMVRWFYRTKKEEKVEITAMKSEAGDE